MAPLSFETVPLSAPLLLMTVLFCSCCIRQIGTFLESHEMIRADDPNIGKNQEIHLPGRSRDSGLRGLGDRYWNNVNDPLWNWDPMDVSAPAFKNEVLKKPADWDWSFKEEYIK